MVGTLRLELTEDGYIRNVGDELGDDLVSMTPIERELRQATINLSLSVFNRTPDDRIAKVWARRSRQRPDEQKLRQRCRIGGYVTLLRYINGTTPRQMEQILGFVPGFLRDGVEIALSEHKPAKDGFAPRYTTLWPAGVPPVMRDRLAAKDHPSYPSARRPVYQWCIHTGYEIPGHKVAILGSDSEVFSYP